MDDRTSRYAKLFVGAALAGAVVALSWANLTAANDAPGESRTTEPTEYEKARQMLPDFSEGLAGEFGPFHWGRAMDLGEDVRFCDANGLPKRDGNHIWLYQYARFKRSKGLEVFVHARNNFTSRDKNVAYRVQPTKFILNTDGFHNSKIIFGYVQEDFRFLHADNCDLAHLAGADRLLVFLPVRHTTRDHDPLDQSEYHVNTWYQSQSPCVIQFKAGEMIHYEYFGDPNNLDSRIIADLMPYFSGENRMKPGVTKPLFQFDLEDNGGWTLRIERDGRDGLAGGPDAKTWDHVIRHTDKGNRGHSLDLKPGKTRWALSVFSPGGSPLETSEIVLGLQPYSRSTGKDVKWPDRKTRIRTAPVEDLPYLLEGKRPPKRNRKK